MLKERFMHDDSFPTHEVFFQYILSKLGKKARYLWMRFASRLVQETRSDWLRLPNLLGDYWTRLNNRPPRSTPTTAPLVSRVKKPRCPLNSPLVMMYSSLLPGRRPKSLGEGSGGGSFSAAARISGLIRSSSLSLAPTMSMVNVIISFSYVPAISWARVASNGIGSGSRSTSPK